MADSIIHFTYQTLFMLPRKDLSQKFVPGDTVFLKFFTESSKLAIRFLDATEMAEEFPTDNDVNLRSSDATNAQLTGLEQPQPRLMGTLSPNISFDASHLGSGDLNAENLGPPNQFAQSLPILSYDQNLFQTTQLPSNNDLILSVDQLTRNSISTNDQTLNYYHLPVSTLPPDFLLPTSFPGFQGQPLQPQPYMPFGNLSDPRMEDSTQKEHFLNLLLADEIPNPDMEFNEFQGFTNLASTGSHNGGSSSHSQYPVNSGQKVPFGNLSDPFMEVNTQQPHFLALSQAHDISNPILCNKSMGIQGFSSGLAIVPCEGGSSSHSKYPVIQGEKMPIGTLSDPCTEASTKQAPFTALSQAHEISNPGSAYYGTTLGNQGFPNIASGSRDVGSTPSHSQYPVTLGKRKMPYQDDSPPDRKSWSVLQPLEDQWHRYSVYDAIYETIGLPADPHLRSLVLSKRNNGKFNQGGRKP